MYVSLFVCFVSNVWFDFLLDLETLIVCFWINSVWMYFIGSHDLFYLFGIAILFFSGGWPDEFGFG